MDYKFMLCVKVVREKFYFENFCDHDNILGIVEKGSFTFSDGSGWQTVGPCEGVIFKKDKSYNRHVIDTVTMHLFRYQSDVDFFENSKIVFRDRSRIQSTVNLLNQVEDNCYYNEFEYKKSLFSDILTQYCLENSRTVSIQSEDKAIANAIKVINRDYSKKINLNKLAEMSFLSYVQFARRFKHATGVTPQEYINDVRMKNARYLLSESRLSIKEIAVSCGYSNEYYFSKFFKEYNKITPSTYRKTFMT